MFYKDREFWEKERNSPFFDRSGLTSERQLVMLLPKFRNIVRILKVKTSPEHSASRNCPALRADFEAQSSKEAEILLKDKPAGKDGAETVGKDDKDVEELTKILHKVTLAPSESKPTTDSNHVEKESEKGNAADEAAAKEDAEKQKSELENVYRIFRLDCERTFVDEKYRKVLEENLRLAYESVRDYHQGEGFVVALLSIYMAGRDLVNVVRYLNGHLLVGYFSAAPKNYVRDSRVLFRLLESRNPELHANLSALIVPEAFCSKWFIGLNIHLFDFETVTDYLTYLFKFGQAFLFQFGLGFFKYFQKELMTKDVGHALKLLRLDESVLPAEPRARNDVYQGILFLAIQEEVDLAEVDALRTEVEHEMQAEEERRKKVLENLVDDDDEIVFSDEE